MSDDQQLWDKLVNLRDHHLRRPGKASRLFLGVALVRYLRSICPTKEIAAIIDGLSDEPAVADE